MRFYPIIVRLKPKALNQRK